MKERLQVKNFGPLKDIDMELKDFMVLIGPQGVGKSAIAKLLVARNKYAIQNSNLLADFLKEQGISWFTEKSALNWNGGSLFSNSGNDVLIGANRKDLEDLAEKIESEMSKWDEITSEANSYSNFSPNWDNVHKSFKSLIDNLEIVLSSNYLQSQQAYSLVVDSLTSIKLECVSLYGHSGKDRVTQKHVDSIRNILLNSVELVNYVKSTLPIQPHYIPAERGFLPSVTGLTLNLMQNKVPLAPGLLDFGATFEKARIAIPNFENPLLGITYKYENGTDKIYLKDGIAVDLKDAASGYQTIVPLMLVVEYLTKEKNLSPHYFIIEEPELNLYPSTQKALVEWLVKKCKESNSKLLMTTHSPYILTALDNLIKAGEVAKQKPEEEKNINKIVKKDYWLDFDNVGVYYINKGKAKNLMNKTNRTINATAIDDVSDELGTTFDKLLSIQYPSK